MPRHKIVAAIRLARTGSIAAFSAYATARGRFEIIFTLSQPDLERRDFRSTDISLAERRSRLP
jgi:hypothetical protein